MRCTTPSRRASSRAGASSTTRRSRSSHGDSACASCHVFGDNDEPGVGPRQPGRRAARPTPTRFQFKLPIRSSSLDPTFTPMKGPMTTQSLRGMANHGPMHWRGDRTGSRREPNVAAGQRRLQRARGVPRSSRPGSPACSAAARPLPDADMDAFTDFSPAGHVPAEPDPQSRQLADAGPAGRTRLLLQQPQRRGEPDQLPGLPRLDPDAQRRVRRQASRASSAPTASRRREVFPQIFKIPHLRNVYTKVGMFGFVN